jgi:hypothetical protein
MKTTWELSAEFLEQLRGIDIREPFEAATHQGPDHRQRVECTRTAFGIDRLRSVWNFLSGNRGRSRRNWLCNSSEHHNVLRHLCDTWLNDALKTAQVARFGLAVKSWTYLASPPSARKTGHKGRQIRRFGCDAERFFSIGECH